ncbi:fibrinogen C domain-containing protein 1-A-like [Watersipora subatra]|uniref:fibrinogen C domain-containing protein 1-A-like n=1 Tax=Watersipora subatra TaxID=2589382 RepID=UPI00355B42C3
MTKVESIDAESHAVMVTVNGYTGNAGDSLIVPHDGEKFSTFDNDNDSRDINCASTFYGEGAWWYDRCHASNLNGKWVDGGNATYGTGIVCARWKGHEYSFKAVSLKLGH